MLRPARPLVRDVAARISSSDSPPGAGVIERPRSEYLPWLWEATFGLRSMCRSLLVQSMTIYVSLSLSLSLLFLLVSLALHVYV